MASALLVSRNEPCWGESKVYMRPNPNPSPLLCTYSNPSPSHHPNQIPNDDGHRTPRPMESDESTASATAVDRRDPRGFVIFEISSYSKKELRDLKRRLVFELDQVRSVKSRIESRDFHRSIRSNGSAAAAKADQIHRHSAEMKKIHNGMMKRCGQILTKLMKNKGAIWFNSPVDVVGMGLHDYHQIIKNPMDLGTVKLKLGKGLYTDPLEFAAEVRLTFRNALVYNPNGHDVHRLADQLLRQFEGAFGPAHNKYEKQTSAQSRAQAMQPPPAANPAKQAKPKVNDASGQRAMSMKEKERLGTALQNLREDSMNEVLRIIRKRNVEMPRDGDEVEIDFDLMDNETIWELDRFVNSCYKTTTSMMKLPLVGNGKPQSASDAEQRAERMKKEEAAAAAAEEDEVDIGDEMPAANYPSVEIERKDSSSSSGSDSSSSSSDSDSRRSCSGSDSEDEGGDDSRPQQPANNM